MKRFGAGLNRAQNWQRYEHEAGHRSGDTRPVWEGVDVMFLRRSSEGKIETSLAKMRAAMCNCGVLTINELHREAQLVIVSPAAIREGGAHDIIQSNPQRTSELPHRRLEQTS